MWIVFIKIRFANEWIGDSKRAMDEYTSEIMMGGHNTIVIHNTCEDSLLAAPLILDLVVLAELCSRIKVCTYYVNNINRQYNIIMLSLYTGEKDKPFRVYIFPTGVVNSELSV